MIFRQEVIVYTMASSFEIRIAVYWPSAFVVAFVVMATL
jgi:hypothetical protein